MDTRKPSQVAQMNTLLHSFVAESGKKALFGMFAGLAIGWVFRRPRVGIVAGAGLALGLMMKKYNTAYIELQKTQRLPPLNQSYGAEFFYQRLRSFPSRAKSTLQTYWQKCHQLTLSRARPSTPPAPKLSTLAKPIEDSKLTTPIPAPAPAPAIVSAEIPTSTKAEQSPTGPSVPAPFEAAKVTPIPVPVPSMTLPSEAQSTPTPEPKAVANVDPSKTSNTPPPPNPPQST